MLGLATKKNLKEQDGATDYKLEMLYDYIDQVEEKIDGDIESVYEQMQHERTALTVTIMSIDKITAQKSKSVKKK